MQVINKNHKGFTLIEVLVALTIFMIFMISITSSYLDIAQSQREANAIREIYSEIRYIYSLISEEARSKTIDYGCPHDSSSGSTFSSTACTELSSKLREEYLALISADGTMRTIFMLDKDSDDETKLYMTKENFTGEIWEPAKGYGAVRTFVPIDLQYIKLKGFEFRIAPLADPFASANIACGPVQFQPSVSIYSSITGKHPNVSDFSLNLQTTISSRVYNKQTQI